VVEDIGPDGRAGAASIDIIESEVNARKDPRVDVPVASPARKRIRFQSKTSSARTAEAVKPMAEAVKPMMVNARASEALKLFFMTLPFGWEHENARGSWGRRAPRVNAAATPHGRGASPSWQSVCGRVLGRAA
jgi:hypothetical protein